MTPSWPYAPLTVGLWPRAAALLARQALEAGLDDFWTSRGFAAMAECGTHASRVCGTGMSNSSIQRKLCVAVSES